MLGAIIGDIVGSTRERRNVKTEDFRLLPYGSKFTDDTVMTLAVAQWLMNDPSHSEGELVKSLQTLGRRYYRSGYGRMFRKWLLSDDPKPYNSFGNGSAMRVSPVGLYANSIEEALELARISASVTHNHPEGIKGAQAIAACIFMARKGESKANIKKYVSETFSYDLNRTISDIRPTYSFSSSCQGSVPEAIIAYLESKDFVDALRKAISLGGDSDTIGAMTASIAASEYDIPFDLANKCKRLLSIDLAEIMERFEHRHKIRSIAYPNREFTPKRITKLNECEIFVFGSNLDGLHAGRAARTAMMRFGAVWGQGVGLQGQSYAIPTMQGGVNTIKPYVDEFIDFARKRTDLFFYVTRIGCGIAGFKDEDIAPLFAKALDIANICLPKSFVDILKPVVPKELTTIMLGQMRTLVDLLKTLNAEEPIKNADDAEERLKKVMKQNVRYNDEYAFLALRTIWHLINQYQQEGKSVDIEKLEKDAMDYHNFGRFEKMGKKYGIKKTIQRRYGRCCRYPVALSLCHTGPIGNCA